MEERLVAGVETYGFAGLPAGTHLGMPSTTLTLVVSLDEPLVLSDGPAGTRRGFGVSIAGLHSAPVSIHHNGRMRGVEIDLTPAGARALLGCPAGELAHQVLELTDVMGPAADRMRHRLHEVSEIDQVRVLAGLFGPRTRAKPMDERLARAWTRLEACHGIVSITDLAADTGWSPRHFTQRFTREFGQGPKTVARVVRFGRSRAMVRHGIPAAEVASRCGYADQPHLVREWRQLSGTTPGRWADDDQLAFVQDRDAARGAR